MRIAIVALGSRGDVQPYVALGVGLKAAGYTVRVITHTDFEALVGAHDLDYWPVRGSVQEVVESKEMRELIEKGNFIRISMETSRQAKRAALNWAEDSLEGCRGVELLIAGVGGMFVAGALAEKLNIPIIQAFLFPFTPTRAFPSILLPASLSRLGGFFNRASHHVTQQVIWQAYRSADSAARNRVLNLPAAPFWGPFRSERLRQHPVLYGFSPSVIAKPADWGADTHITGYWYLDPAPGWSPPPGLTEFLNSGPAPVCIGFGSMGNRKPEETAKLVLDAVAQSRHRAVILSGWGGLSNENLPDTVYMADSIPHAWLFPRMAAVVHHGGAGTTAAGFRAGVPSIITPFFGDQMFWGKRAAALGVGTEPIPRKKLTAERLARIIQTAVTDPDMRQRAAELGAKIQAEDGVAQAVSIIRHLQL